MARFVRRVPVEGKQKQPSSHEQSLSSFSLRKVLAAPSTGRRAIVSQVRNIDVGNTEILFNQFGAYLKNYLAKNNTKQNCETTMKLTMEEKWLKFFVDARYIDQKSCLIKLWQYAFAIQAHNANVEIIFSLMSIQWSRRKKLAISGDN
ncbi:hypothetical protein AVEN_234723-1 [Araneus ventricosus]|uniref:Uncharacterized protein n=1 Tax=Araneus ventricosus TaxID=182803 RepID=A0A4Y2HUN5_ARAVE|nr:hypothetical protein AVEN_234723-1 [Araneus ventricosus]